MKKIMFICLFALTALTASAQKFALLDMEYILKNIPAYERANEQLNQVSKKWQAEVEALNTEASTMYKNYQNELVFLSQEQKKARQEAIMKKEKEASDLKRKYFGPEGELFKKRESLMSPIQDEIYNTVKEISELRGYSLVLDRASESWQFPEPVKNCPHLQKNWIWSLALTFSKTLTAYRSPTQVHTASNWHVYWAHCWQNPATQWKSVRISNRNT